MKKKFEMPMFGEIKFFVGLQVYQMKFGIFITQSKYIKETLFFFWNGRIKTSERTYVYGT